MVLSLRWCFEMKRLPTYNLSMKYLCHFPAALLVICISLLLPLGRVVAIGQPPALQVPAGLAIAEIKITGDEYVIIQNNSTADISDTSVYWLQSFNNTSPLASGASTASQQLPASALAAGGTLLLSANSRPTCGAAVAGKLSLSLTDAGGFMQIVKVSQNSRGAVEQTPGDFLSWSSTATGIIQSVPSNTKNPQGMYYRYKTGDSYNWQLAEPDVQNGCQLGVISIVGTVVTKLAVDTGLLPNTETIPFTILAVEETGTAEPATPAPVFPASDVGLQSPQLSELLPNPVGTGTDSTDEYIELYNSNAVSFDLSGFKLSVGMTTQRIYMFPAGTTLAPNAFRAFYAPETKLSLSNTASVVSLLDPFDELLSASEAYKSAKDGQAWALTKDAWSWTTELTPGKANIIKMPATKKAASKTTAKKSKTTTPLKVAAKSAAKPALAKKSYVDQVTSRPVHIWVLATVALLAVLYGAYEYRHDIANRLTRLKRQP